MISLNLPLTVFGLWTSSLVTAFQVPDRERPTGVAKDALPSRLLHDESFDDVSRELGRTATQHTRRRSFQEIAAAALLPSLFFSGEADKCWAADKGVGIISQTESAELGVGLLESRVAENVLSPPSYGMETTDVFYPSWFSGSWQVSSKTVDVQAPCGTALFGGNATYERARKEIGTTMNYESRFLPDGSGNVIADREYNVRSIAKAAMGQYSVLDIPVASPNKLSCILAPKGSPSMLRVDLIALNRRQETISKLKFDCSEVTREIVAPVSNSNNPQVTAAT